MPAVSVIVATYNRAPYLGQALRSVLSQDYSDFEVIIVDDGSTDATADMMSAITDTRIRYVPQANAGRSAARNRGVALARSPLVTFLDDDDLWLPNKLSRQVAFMARNVCVDILGCGAELIDADGRTQGLWLSSSGQVEVTLMDAVYACPFMPSTIMIRQSAFGKVKHIFDPEIELGEDKDLFVRLLLAGARAVLDSDPLVLHRVHPGSSQGNGERYSASSLKCLDKLFLAENLPDQLLRDKRRLYAHYHLIGSLHAYATGHLDSGRRDLISAFELDPTLLEGNPPRFVECAAGFATTFHVSDPGCFLDSLFENLPPQLSALRSIHRRTLSAYFMNRVFTAASDPVGQADLGFCIRGMLLDPRWLMNRGVWSILVRGLVKRVWEALKRRESHQQGSRNGSFTATQP